MTQYYVSNSTANGWSVGSGSGTGLSTSDPFLKFVEADAIGGNGHTFTVNDGTYIENSGANFLRFQSGGTWNPLNNYAVTIQAFSVAAAAACNIRPNADGLTFVIGAFNIDMQGPTYATQGFYIEDGSATVPFNVDLTAIKIINGEDSRLPINSDAPNINLTIDGAIINHPLGSKHGIFIGTLLNGHIAVKNCAIDIGDVTLSNANMIYIAASGSGTSGNVTYETSNNTGGMVVNGAAGVQAGILIENIPTTIDPTGNEMNISGTGEAALYWVRANTGTVGTATGPLLCGDGNWNNNSGKLDTDTTGYHFLGGRDAITGARDFCNNIEVSYNTFTSGVKVANYHGIMFGYNLGGHAHHNTGGATRIPLISKGQTGATAAVFEYNTYLGRTTAGLVSEGMMSKGSDGAVFRGNIVPIRATDSAYPSAFMTLLGDGATNSINTEFDSNEFESEAGSDLAEILNTTDINQTATWSNNCYEIDTYPSPSWTYATVTYSDIAVWGAANEPNYRTSCATSSPTLTTPYPLGTNNGPLFTSTSSDTIATVEGAGFLNDLPGWASLLKTGDVVIIECSNGTKMYTVTVDVQARIITLSTGLLIA